ncbi:MAG: hypothetical protein OEX04_03240 [Acidimicrobiia bacterium]|nr:hypothetical protein [Acidimicrobiia bacterium]MDH5292946.1 hypothetical protein [Acidimicrobiia bacterium]
MASAQQSKGGFCYTRTGNPMTAALEASTTAHFAQALEALR